MIKSKREKKKKGALLLDYYYLKTQESAHEEKTIIKAYNGMAQCGQTGDKLRTVRRGRKTEKTMERQRSK